MLRYSLVALVALGFTGCAYTQSALEYAKEGTARVDSGYKAKAEMTKSLVSYLQEANRNCGTTMEVVDGKPVVNVKECVRVQDVLASVDKVEIVKPQQVNDMLNSAGDFIMKATNMVVPVAGVYYNYKTHEKSMAASVANTASNNALQKTIFENFENTTVTTTTTDTSVSDTTNTSSDIVLVADTTSSITDTTTDTSVNNVSNTSSDSVSVTDNTSSITDTSVSDTTNTSSDSVSVTDNTSNITDTSVTNVADTSVTDGTNTATIGN
jgi:hypothetical protein